MAKNGRPHLLPNAGRPVQKDVTALTAKQRAFVACYQANGGNGTRAYLESHPLCRSHQTAAQEAWRLLRTPKVKALLDRERAERFKRLQMDGDEAMARIAAYARADIGDAYDDDGKLLPVHQWPDSLRLAVKSVREGQFGDQVTLHDALRANELIATAEGRIRQAVDLKHSFDHAKYLAGEPPDDG